MLIPAFFKSSKWLQRVMTYAIALPTILFFLISFLLILYTFLPRSLDLPSIDTERNMTILAHGIHDTPLTWSNSLADIIEERDDTNHTIPLDWSKYAQSTFRCSVDGERLGRKIGQLLSSNKSLQSLHLIGHSCGSFVIYGICRGIREQSPWVNIQTTYLDPVSIYGGIFPNYGIDNFGNCANFSEAYIDTGDTVPGSNQLLPNTHTFDVTTVRHKARYTGTPHIWPTKYYTELTRSGLQPLLSREKDIRLRFRPNVLDKIESQPVAHD